MRLDSDLRRAASSQPNSCCSVVSSDRVAALIASARQAADRERNLADAYLEQLSALLGPGVEDDIPDGALLPRRAAADESAAKGGLAGWQVRRVTEHVEQRLDGNLTTGQLATVARLSTGHFCRAFKASMGETPHAYVIRQRVRKAQTLMLRTRDTLSQIACACGLTDQAHLTRLFRRVVGTTPMSWRRNWQRAR